MKFIRLLLSGLILVIALAAVLAAAALVPTVQTWVAEMMLARQSGVDGSLGSFSAEFGKVEVQDLHLKTDGAELTLPSLKAEVPLTTAAWDRRVSVRSLVAKGWTLDLSRKGAPGNSPGSASADAGAEASSAPLASAAIQTVERYLGAILGSWRLPCDATFDGVDLEGDVLVSTPFDQRPARVHVAITGGGVAAGRDGAFTVVASSEFVDAAFQLYSASARAGVVVAMDAARILRVAEAKASLSARGGSLPEDLVLSADVAAGAAADRDSCVLELSRGRRHLASVQVRLAGPAGRLGGIWRVDLRDSDLAPFASSRPLPSLAVSGDGTFGIGPALDRIRARGRLHTAAANLGALAPALEALGAVTLDTRFDLTQSGPSLRFAEFHASLAGARPVAEVRSLQPFAVDEQTGDLQVTDPKGDWLEASIRGLPLNWLAGLTDGFTVTGGDATGAFVVRAAPEGFVLRPHGLLTAAGVAVGRDGRTLGRGLDLSLRLLADEGPGGWQVRAAPLAVAGGGRRLASMEAKASRSGGSDQPVAIAGSWTADLGALAGQPAIPAARWIGGRSASGTFSATLGATPEIDAQLAAVGRNPAHTISASAHADVGADGSVEFTAPVTIAVGPTAAQVSAEGLWSTDESGPRFDGKLTSEAVTPEQLRWLAVPLAAAGGLAISPSATGGPASGTRDRMPFWGNWTGTLRIAFDHVTAGERDLKNVAGTFEFTPGSMHLGDGRADLSQHASATAGGSITFDAAARYPYHLLATAAADQIDVAPYFAAAGAGQPPVLEGRFGIASTLTGNGANLGDLIARTREEFRLTSTVGIVRLLATDVTGSAPDTSNRATDALGMVGSRVGSFFGIGRRSADSGDVHLSKGTEAVLDFADQVAEIGYDRMTVTAIRGADRTIHLADVVVTAPGERLTGSGEITYVKGLPLRARPLQLDLQVAARGGIADLLRTAGLLSSRQDDLGYTLLRQPIRFGGALEHVDASQWHDLLVQAANRPPAVGK